MNYGERGNNMQGLHQAAEGLSRVGSSHRRTQARRRQQQREQKKKMVRAYYNVANDETECALEPGRPRARGENA
jgi:hypothetical protein